MPEFHGKVYAKNLQDLVWNHGIIKQPKDAIFHYETEWRMRDLVKAYWEIKLTEEIFARSAYSLWQKLNSSPQIFKN
jgi:hypothetical protein